jgi:Zn-finger nucleic acid-binding protein
MECPRDRTLLSVERYDGIDVDRCRTCNGRWLDNNELDLLEATVPSTEEERRATIQYARRTSELKCPVCSQQMIAFNYRAYNLEIDTCKDEHGFWLDSGEDGKVRDIIAERVRGLERAASAEASWRGFLNGVRRNMRGRGGRYS